MPHSFSFYWIHFSVDRGCYLRIESRQKALSSSFSMLFYSEGIRSAPRTNWALTVLNRSCLWTFTTRYDCASNSFALGAFFLGWIWCEKKCHFPCICFENCFRIYFLVQTRIIFWISPSGRENADAETAKTSMHSTHYFMMLQWYYLLKN